MANNMIALQARAPQSDFLGGAIQRNAQMINMARQQDAADRQNAIAARNADLAASQEARAVSKEAREASAAEIDLAGKQIDFYTKLAGQVMNPAGYQGLLTRLDKDAPEIAQAFRTNLPPEQFDRNMLLQMIGSIGDNFKATYGPLETQVVQDQEGNYGVATTGGFSAERGQQGVVPLNELRRKTPVAPAASGGIAPAGGLKPTRGVNTTPRDLEAQLDAAAQAVARGAGVNDPALRNLGENDFLEAQKRASRIMQNSPEFQQMSMQTGGAPAQADIGGIVQQMMQTGVVSQSDVQALRAAAGPQKEAQLAQLMRANNIQIMPDEGGAGGMQNAVYNPSEGIPTRQNVQAMGGYEDTGRQFRGKSPMQSPLPGSAQVPLKRVRAEAQAGRETPEQVTARVAAEERGKNIANREQSGAEQKRAAENFFRVTGVNPRTKADPVADLIRRSTSGAIEAVGAELAGALPEEIGGGATSGAQAIGELQTIAAKLTNDLLGGKLGTGISNEDRKMIERLVGDIANPFISSGKRLASWQRVKQIQASYIGNGGATVTKRRVVRTGVHNGRRVVQYEDGSLEYAN